MPRVKLSTHKVTPFLWFEDQAEAAAKFYVSLFPRSRITSIARRGRKAFTVSFELDGTPFVALNGGPHFKLTPAFSLFVSCRDQREIDSLWKKLLRGGGEPSRCGWLVDRFGLSWQVIPEQLPALVSDPRGMAAMLAMEKIDLAALRAAVRD
jgi:predicted 3-demethylubiquinone-9 3-methyltransferase (glyoxalase superfamily)